MVGVPWWGLVVFVADFDQTLLRGKRGGSIPSFTSRKLSLLVILGVGACQLPHRDAKCVLSDTHDKLRLSSPGLSARARNSWPPSCGCFDSVVSGGLWTPPLWFLSGGHVARPLPWQAKLASLRSVLYGLQGYVTAACQRLKADNRCLPGNLAGESSTRSHVQSGPFAGQ